MIFRYKVIITSVLATAAAILSGCQEEKFRTNDVAGSYIGISVNVPSTWQGGVAEASQRAASQCAVITKLDSDTPQPLYLHTTSEPDSVYACTLPPSSRGTMISDKEHFHSHFSLSGICYTGTYPSEPDNKWTPEFAHNLKYDKSGTPVDGTPLQWPGSGAQVKFFAFAPYPDENNKNITLSGPTATGSPCITYTVPEDATKQTDLMVAVADVSSATGHTDVELKFGHALTAVKVKASETMLECKVESVTFSGIYTTGTYNMGSATWEGTAPTGECNAALNQQTPSETSKIVDGEYTFLMLPQILPDGATLKIVYTETFTGATRTLSAPISGKEWKAGNVVTYEVSTSSISVVAGIEILTPIPAETEEELSPPKEKELSVYYNETDKNGEINKIPYTGVLYDLTFKPYIETSEADNAHLVKKYLDNPDDFTITATYTVGTDSESASIDVTKKDDGDGFKGVLDMSALSPYKKLNLHEGFNSTPALTKLEENKFGETANCYMIDAPGDYSFPLVYGNALNNPSAYTIQHPEKNISIRKESVKDDKGNTVGTKDITIKGMKHYVNHNNNMIEGPDISGAAEAILVWQDSPDLVRDVKLKDYRVTFHVDERTIAQGNAMIAVRDASKTILWSWHIWVTTAANKNAWDNPTHLIKAKDNGNGVDDDIKEYQYYMTPTNLGYCEPHEACPAQTITLNLSCKAHLKTQGQNKRDIESTLYTFTFSQEGIEESYAGDNTYYQWGRKDPLPPGVYDKANSYSKGDGSNDNNIRNKPLHNVYPGYEKTRTSKDSEGVSIGYTIQHPNEQIMGRNKDVETDNGKLNFRKHWHNTKEVVDKTNLYLPKNEGDTHYVLFSLWNSNATGLGEKYTANPLNFQEVIKTIYDPCPPGYHVPPAGAFLALAKPALTLKTYNPIDGEENAPQYAYPFWTVRGLTFPAVGMRDLNLKSDPYTTTDDKGIVTKYPERGTPLEWEKQSWCSFNQITFITSSTLAYTDGGLNQELIFYADKRDPPVKYKVIVDGKEVEKESQFRYGACLDSNNAYGMPVRPVQTVTTTSNETSR